jgi:hypothetical protein
MTNFNKTAYQYAAALHGRHATQARFTNSSSSQSSP